MTFIGRMGKSYMGDLRFWGEGRDPRYRVERWKEMETQSPGSKSYTQRGKIEG